MSYEKMPDVQQILKNTEQSIESYGVYHKICNGCGKVVGGRLVEFGEPTPEELERCLCPYCGNCRDGKNLGFRIEKVVKHGG